MCTRHPTPCLLPPRLQPCLWITWSQHRGSFCPHRPGRLLDLALQAVCPGLCTQQPTFWDSNPRENSEQIVLRLGKKMCKERSPELVTAMLQGGQRGTLCPSPPKQRCRPRPRTRSRHPAPLPLTGCPPRPAPTRCPPAARSAEESTVFLLRKKTNLNRNTSGSPGQEAGEGHPAQVCRCRGGKAQAARRLPRVMGSGCTPTTLGTG